MTDPHLKLLLKIISNDTDTSLLMKQGLTYAQISKLINNSISDGYLEETDDLELTLTQKGLDVLEDTSSHLCGSKKQNWICRDEQHKIDKRNVEDIFLPTLEESKNLI